MAHYKHIDTSPRFLAVGLQRQLLQGTLEHVMNYLFDNELDLPGFDVQAPMGRVAVTLNTCGCVMGAPSSVSPLFNVLAQVSAARSWLLAC